MAALSDEMLDHLYVHPDAQEAGAGSALLDKAKERRPGGFTFWVFQQNENARAFTSGAAAGSCGCGRERQRGEDAGRALRVEVRPPHGDLKPSALR